jgi:hypothetical protein
VTLAVTVALLPWVFALSPICVDRRQLNVHSGGGVVAGCSRTACVLPVKLSKWVTDDLSCIVDVVGAQQDPAQRRIDQGTEVSQSPRVGV